MRDIPKKIVIPENSNGQMKELAFLLNKFFSKNVKIQNLLYQMVVLNQMCLDAAKKENERIQKLNNDHIDNLEKRMQSQEENKDNYNNVINFIKMLNDDPKNVKLEVVKNSKGEDTYKFKLGNKESFTLKDDENLQLQKLYLLNSSELPQTITNIIKEVNDLM